MRNVPPRFGPDFGAQPDHVVLRRPVFGERTPLHARPVDLDQLTLWPDHEGAMTPMCEDPLGAAKPALLGDADELSDQVLAVGEHEIARLQPSGFVTGAVALGAAGPSGVASQTKPPCVL